MKQTTRNTKKQNHPLIDPHILIIIASAAFALVNTQKAS